MRAPPVEEVDHPVHVPAKRARFTTVNFEEALPGLVEPLTWTYYQPAIELGTLRMYRAMGVVPGRDVRIHDDIDERQFSVFYGRAAINVDVAASLSDRLPGVSGADFEASYFGRSREWPPSSKRRYPIIVAAAPVAIARARRSLLSQVASVDVFWRGAIDELASDRSVATAHRLFRAGHERFTEIMFHHMVISFAASGLHVQLAKLTSSLDMPGAEADLLKTDHGTDEIRMMHDLWAVSRGEQTLAAFLELHGFHGPGEGHLSATPWREDAAPLESLLDAYRAAGDDQAPAVVAARRGAERDAAVAALRAKQSGPRGAVNVRLASMAASFMALREVGRAGFLRALDVSRAAAAVVGERLHADGRLPDPSLVHQLTVEELLEPGDGLGALTEGRRDVWEGFRGFTLPEFWEGSPSTDGDAPIDMDEGPVSGLGVSPGIVEGRARVIVDPSKGQLEDGEILVCRTTDPSWAVFFQLAAAVVIDVGGQMSHGAIVARELGLPAVVNTRTGTGRITTGMRLRVNGTTGTVEILDGG